jgi:hypothetical protein
VDHLPSAARGEEEIRLDSGLLGQRRSAPLDTAHEQSIVERIAIDAGGGEHGDTEHTLDRSAAARVHDVAISHAPAREEPL